MTRFPFSKTLSPAAPRTITLSTARAGRRRSRAWLVLGSMSALACAPEAADEAPVDTLGEQVVQGTIEPDAQFPWVVRVSASVTCHGTLIEPRWVLTAAHCIDSLGLGVTVSYERTDPATNLKTGKEVHTGPGSVFVHPDYQGLSHDIALVRLPSALDLVTAPDPLLRPALLPAAAGLQGAPVVVASKIHHNAPALPAGRVAVWRGTTTVDGTNSLLAKSPNASLCPGDSGSGVISTQGGRNVIVGVATRTTNTDACDRPNQEFEATKVSAYLDWIRSYTGVQTPYRYLPRSLPMGAPAAAGAPSGIAFPALNVTNVVYRASSGRLHELWQQGGTLGTSDLSGLAGAPSAAGAPTSFLSTDGNEVALYRGTDNQVHSLYWNTGAVGHDALSAAAGAPSASGNPVGYTSPDGWTHVIYRTSSQRLEELYWFGQGAVSHGSLMPAGAPLMAASDPAVYATPSNQSIVIYRGTDNHVHSLYWTNGAGTHEDLSGYAGSPPAAGRPAAYYRANDDSHQIVYRATNGHLYELWWVGASPVQAWDLTAAAGAPAAASDPAAFYSPATNTKHVAYNGTDGHLHEIVWPPGGATAHADLSFESGAAAPSASDAPSGFTEAAARTEHVVYRGTDGHVHEVRWQVLP